jgi:hypothetical protein
MIALTRFLIVIALLGLVLGLISHALMLAGFDTFRHTSIPLSIGLFAVWIPMNILVFRIRFPDFDLLNWEWDWRSIFRGSPIWLHFFWALLFVYAIFASGQKQLSAILLAFYAIALSTLYSIHRQPWLLVGLSCPNGHKVSLSNRFCPDCGSSLPKRKGSA